MKTAILSKLATELQQDIQSERQVVYTLVELRKLIELNGDGKNYFALQFYCDWAVHPIMDRAGAQRIVRQFDAYQAVMDQMDTAPDQEIKLGPQSLNGVADIVRLATFKNQLCTYLKIQGLSAAITEDREQWIKFLVYYSRVIEDCPLRCIDDSLEHTDEVSVSVLESAPEPLEAAQFRLVTQWCWTSKQTGKPHVINCLF